MPPAKKHASSSGPSVATLIGRLAREDLESLLVRAVEGGTLLARNDVLALLPEEKQGKEAVPRAAPIASAAARTGTGRFDDLDDDILVNMILMRLPSKDRFTCAKAVCKPWRSLQEVPALWRDIAIHYSDRDTRTFGIMDGGSLLQVLKWLTTRQLCAGLTTLQISAGDFIAPDAIKKMLSALPGLTSLSLSGKKITNAVLTSFAKSPAAKNLTTFHLTDVGGSVKPQEAIKLLPLMSRVRVLSVATHLANHETLGQISTSIRRARDGGSPLLTELHLTSSFGGTCTYRSLGELGNLFPELEVLSVASLSDNHYGDECAAYVTAHVQRGIKFSIARLPRLRRLSINELAGFTCNMGTDEFEMATHAILVACPVLEHLSIRHGMMWTGGSNPVPAQPLPRATSCFNALPSTIKSLKLAQIQVTTAAFETAVVPELREIELDQCGPDAEATGKLLVSASPKSVSLKWNSCAPSRR